MNIDFYIRRDIFNKNGNTSPTFNGVNLPISVNNLRSDPLISELFLFKIDSINRIIEAYNFLKEFVNNNKLSFYFKLNLTPISNIYVFIYEKDIDNLYEFFKFANYCFSLIEEVKSKFSLNYNFIQNILNNSHNKFITTSIFEGDRYNWLEMVLTQYNIFIEVKGKL